MRTITLPTATEFRLPGLTLRQEPESAEERLRHRRFMAARLLAGGLALAYLPWLLLWRGSLSWEDPIAALCLAASAASAVVLARTGRLQLAQGLSASAFAALIAVAIVATGEVALAIWFLAIPLDALVSGSRRASLVAAASAALAALGFGALALLSGPWPSNWTIGTAGLVLAATALGQAAAHMLARAKLPEAPSAAIEPGGYDRSLLQVIDDLVTWHDRNGHVRQASAAARKLLGVAPDTLHARGLLRRVHVSDRPAFLKAISDAALAERAVAVQIRLHVGEAGTDRPGEAHGATRSQQVIWVEMRAHRVLSADLLCGEGDCTVIAVTRDSSEHKRRSEELELARLKAERADELKGRFLATVSHELRTPLNAIIGFSEILATGVSTRFDSERRREYAQIIRESGQHLLDVVNTLLDMSKIETGNFDFVPEPFDFAALIRGCADLMGLKAEQGGILLARDIEPDLPEVMADRRACRQILINLLSNAVKFTPRGGRVTIGARLDRDRIVLTVADTGIGIPQGDLPRLGDPFFQVAAAYDRRHEGTGLGLSVVRGLVGLHHGELAIESEPGDGTTVTVSLPLDCRTGALAATPIPIHTRAGRGQRPPMLKTG